MRTSIAFVLLLALPAAPASAKQSSKDWRVIKAQFKNLFSQPGAPEKKADLLKVLLKELDDPQTCDLLADAILAETDHVAATAAQVSKDIADLPALFLKNGRAQAQALAQPQDAKAKAEDDASQAEIQQLLGKISREEEGQAAEEKTLDEYARAVLSGTEKTRETVFTGRLREAKAWGPRAVLARIAASVPLEEKGKEMLARSLASTEDPRVKMAALNALSEARGGSWHDLVVERIGDSDWGVQVLAVRLAREKKISKAIPALIAALETCTPRVGYEIYAALRVLTGKVMDPDFDAWRKWWAVNSWKWGVGGQPLQSIPEPEALPPRSAYGLQTKSTAVMFVLDISGSMTEPKMPPHAQKPGASVPTGPKIDFARQRLREAIRALPREATFDVLVFNHQFQLWESKMVPANESNKDLAYQWTKSITPSSSTYTDGALRVAFQVAGIGDFGEIYHPTAFDTLVLVSDGAPTDGAYPENRDMPGQMILDHVATWNRYRRIEIDCVGIDNVEVGKEFMKQLADENNGVYVDG